MQIPELLEMIQNDYFRMIQFYSMGYEEMSVMRHGKVSFIFNIIKLE